MVIDKILILGSTLLTENVVNLLIEDYNLVGYVPSKNPTVPAQNMMFGLPVVNDIKDVEFDIAVSIQYDRIIKDPINCFNVHTGLLPLYGGTNILDYTLQNNEYEQGLTFHKMTNKLDFGPIISKITYPVLPNDKVEDLYNRILVTGPKFVSTSLQILSMLDIKQIDQCSKQEPTIYKRGEFKLNNKLKRYIA